jgi:TRAP-type C4-dicarboxylate transport system permease small subunit
MLKAIDAGIGIICRISLWVSAAIALAIVAVVGTEVICRTLFATTLFVVEEAVGYLLAAFTMFGLAHTLWSGNILRVEVLYGRLSERGRDRAALIFHLVALVYLIILEHQLIRLVLTSHRREIVSVTLVSFPVWVPQALVAAGGMLLTATVVNAILQEGYRVFVGAPAQPEAD